MSKAEIKSEDLTLTINLVELIEALTPPEMDRMAELITWDRIFLEAIKRLTGESVSWAGGDKLLTLEVLSKMERFVLSGYHWDILQTTELASRNLASHEHMYWKMFHDPEHGKFFQEWFEKNNIKSNYTGEFESHEAFRESVEAKLDALREALPSVGGSDGKD